MAKYQFTNKAIADLEEIWSYTVETWSERQADLYYEMLISFCQHITDNPAFGRSYEEIAKGLYGITASKHIIFYRVIAEGEIEVVRILHGKMDLKKRIRQELTNTNNIDTNKS